MTRDRINGTADDSGTRLRMPKISKPGGNESLPRGSDKIRYARAKFGDVVLVCTKCAKRQGLPKGTVRAILKRALKARAGTSKGGASKPRLVEVGCLGPCPKRAVAVATTASLAQGRIALIDPAGDPQAILAALLPDFGPKATLTPLAALEDRRSGPLAP